MKNRKTFLNVICIFVSIFTLQSCTLEYYQIRNELNNNLSSEPKYLCDVLFSVDVQTEIPWRTKENLRKAENEYIQATKKVFNKKGCIANYTENESSLNYKISIYIREQPFPISPQVWLTLLSLGLIPSWGTSPEVFSYTFENTQNKKENKYIIDLVYFNHLILVPIFFLSEGNRFHKIEKHIYMQTLRDFIGQY
jgi:hypothetical protein